MTFYFFTLISFGYETLIISSFTYFLLFIHYFFLSYINLKY